MKNLHTIYTNFAKRLVMSLMVLMTVGVGSVLGAEVTITRTINDIIDENNYTVSSGSTINDIIKSFDLDENITISTTGTGNCGSFWGTTTHDWRLYQNASGNVIVSANNNCTLQSVTFTYTNDNGGRLYDGNNGYTSGTSISLSGTEKTFTVGSSSGKTNGQVRVTKISITYSSAPSCTYTVTFDRNGGTGSMSPQEFTCGESKSLTANSFSRTGYTFTEWNTLADGTGTSYTDQQSVNLSSTNNDNIPLFAQWTPNKYTVNFTASPNGYGTVSQSSIANVPYGTTVTENSNAITINGTTVTATPAAKDANYSYSFNNWSNVPNTITGTCTITANFTRTERELTNYRTTCSTQASVTLNPNGGSFASIPDVWNQDGNNYKQENVAGPIDLPTPTRTGYDFDGWYDDGETKVNQTYTPTKTVTLTAQWTAKTTSITLDANTSNNGSGANSSVTATYDQALPEFTACTPATGYTLDGYYTEAIGGTKIIDKDGKLVSNVSGYTSADGKWASEDEQLKLYAQYLINTYTVEFDNQGHGTKPNNQIINHGGKVNNPGNLTANGFIFGGWYKESGCTNAWNFETDVVTSNITIYAKWTAKIATSLSWSADTYTATIDADNTFPELTVDPEAIKESVQYTSSDETIATIDANGNITLLKKGETTITATFTETPTHTDATASYTLTVNPSNCRWVETEIGDIENGDEVVITMTDALSKTYALPNGEVTNETDILPTLVTVTNHSLQTVSDSIIWIINKDGDNLTFESYSHVDRFLTCNNADKGIRVNNGEYKQFVIDQEYNYLKHTQHNRYLGVHDEKCIWYSYALTDKGNFPTKILGQTLKFYKRECLDASKVWVEGNLTNVTCDTQLPLQLAKDGSITLTFTAADGYALPNDVTVTNATKTWDKTNGKLTISDPTDNVMVTVEAVELHTITWMVGSSSVLTEEVANNTGVTTTPDNPANGAIGECANAFMGWSETPLGSTEGQSAPADLCTAAQMKAKHSSVTGDKTFYAVFATASSGGGENTTEVFATTDIVSSTGVTSGYTISAQAKKESGYYEDGTGEKRYVEVMKSDVSTPMITNIPISITVTAELGGGSTKDDLTNSVYAIWLDKDGEELGDAVFLTDEITAKTGSNFTANLPIANATSAYGVRVYHQKESGYNVRYYGISLSYKYNNVTYSNYVTQCCTDWTPTLTYSKTTLDSETNEIAKPTITGNIHNAPVSFESSNESVLTVDTDDGTITAVGAGKATITATWEKTGDYCAKSITTDEITVNGNFLVTFYANDGSGNTTTQQIPSNTATALNANTFQRDGYTFQGWAISASGAKEYDDKQEVTLSRSGLDLYAVWQVKTYNITIGTITGNGTITTSPTNSANYDAQVTITATPAAHYTFASVTVTRDDNSQTVVVVDNKFTMPASDVTITAVFTENEKFAINYDIPTGGGTLTDNAPTTIYIDGSITLPGIKDGTISSEYSCEEFIGWTTNPANHEAAGLKPEPFYNTGASFSDVSEDVTFYPVYSRPGAGVGGTVTLTEEEMYGWQNASYGTPRDLTTCVGTWTTTGYKKGKHAIQLRSDDSPYVKFPDLSGNITQVVLNATKGTTTTTLTEGTFTLKTEGGTIIASASVNGSGICTIPVTGPYTTAYLYSSVTARITNIAITYGPPAIISTTLDCSSDVDDCTIIYDLNESFLAAGTQVLGSCHNSTFKFSEVGTYTICSEPQANEYKLIGWNNQCDGKGSLTYTPGQEITSLPQNIITLYAQWAPEVIVHDSYEETKVYPTAMGGSITLNSGQYACAPKKYDFIGWTTDDPQLWQQNITPPTLLADNGDGTTTFTPEEPSQVYAVYAIEDLANSDAFKLSSIVEETKYYVGFNESRNGRVITVPTEETALTFYKEETTGSDNYLISYIIPATAYNDPGTKQYLYYYEVGSTKQLQITTNPDVDQGWTLVPDEDGYKFRSIQHNSVYLSMTSGNVQTNGTGNVFNMETVAEYKYIAKTNCSENVTITFVPGNGTMTPSDNPVPAKTGDVIDLPTCTYEGWTFLGWVTENIELTELEIDPSRLYTGTYEVGNSDVTLYAYYTQTPTPADFDGTTSGIWKMYTEVSTDVYKYALSHGSSSPNTLSSTEYCPNATEWTFTNTGEANVYYIQDEDNLYLTPELTNTQLYFTSTPFPWKIVKIDDSDEYRIYKYDTRSDAYERLIMSNQSGLFYHSAKANEGNTGWHHVTIGGCTNPVYTTDPQPSKIISLVGSPMITSTIEQTVKASQKLQLVIKDMDANAEVTIAADGLTFYDTDNNVVNSLQTGPNGSLTATFTVAYTPTVADNQIVKPAITVTCGSTVRTFYNVSCRSLPADFAIVAKVGNLWYALPSQGLNSTDALVGYPVEVDNQNDPTAVTAVPENADWSLRQVYAGQNVNATKDRFEQYGANIMFENNDSPAKMLNASVSYNYLLTDAEYSNYYETNPGLYEWTPTTTDLETYTLTNAQRTDRTLNVATNTVFGVHSDNKATTEVRFLPITGRYTPAALQVVEWKENSVVIMYNGDPAQTASVSVNGGAAQNTTLSSAQRDIAVYELAATGLATNPTQRLSITIGTYKVILPIPYIISGKKTDLALLPGATVAARQEVAKVSDLVILKEATLTAAGASNNLYKFRNVTIYGGGKLVIPSDKGFGVNTLTLRIGGMTEDKKYDYVYPEFVLNGKYTSSSGKINLDYVTTKDQYYTFVAPFAVNTKDIKYPVDIYGNNVAAGNKGSFEFQYYDGAARAAGNTGWTVVEEDPTNGATLTAHQGYTFLGMPKKINGNRQKYGIHRIPMNVTVDNAMSHEKTDQTISVAPHSSAKNNNSGWNLIGNPYMSKIGGLTNENIQVGKLVHTTDANDNWTGGWHWDTSTAATNQRFLVIPSNDGQSYNAVQASNATLPAFKNFFVQISNESANALIIPVDNRVEKSLAPARYAEEQPEKDVEVAIVLEQDEAHSDQMDFLINNSYTEDFERDADFTKMMNATNLNLYGVHPYDNLSFVAIDNNTARGSVAIGYQVPQAGEYILRMSDKPYVMFDRIEALYVTDHEMSPEVTTDIMSEPYRFTVAKAETNHTRFTVSITLKANTEDDVTTILENVDVGKDQPIKFFYQDKLYILRNGIIYDAMGKQVQTINK